MLSRTPRLAAPRQRSRTLRLRSVRRSGSSRRLQGQFTHAAAALHGDQAVGAVVLDRRLDAGIERQFLRREQLLAVDLAVDDPAIDVAFRGGVGDGDRFEIMAILEVAD